MAEDLWLTPFERLARAGADLRRGTPLLLTSAGAAPLLLAALEGVPARALALARGLGRPAAVLSARRASALKIRAYDGDLARLLIPPEAGPELLGALADPAQDLANPLRGPFETLRGEAEGLPEAARARLALRLCARAGLLPAALLTRLAEGAEAPADLLRLDVAEAEAALDAETLGVRRLAAARVPLALAGMTAIHAYRPSDGGTEHYAVVVGQPDFSQPVLTRLHSECLTGDHLGSLKCDCGPQLRAALARLAVEHKEGSGGGILLYLAQEGREIELANKLRAYALQDQGFDTVEANHRLGFEDDLRDFRVAALMLKDLGAKRLRLMTNNPRKIAAMEKQGLEVVARAPLRVGETEENTRYLAVKGAKSGHLL